MQRLRLAFGSLVVLTAAVLAVPGPVIGSGDAPDSPLLADDDGADEVAGGSSATLVYGELKPTATAAEKSVGETWSDPAVGQIASADGPYAVRTGSGFYKYSMQTTYRGGTAAGTTFYIIDAETGDVLDSVNVGNDGLAESGTAGDSCDVANDCTKIKNVLQADPVATGPADSRFINRVYIGDLDGKVWRINIGVNATNEPRITGTVTLYNATTATESHPMFASMATVTSDNESISC